MMMPRPIELPLPEMRSNAAASLALISEGFVIDWLPELGDVGLGGLGQWASES